jgi:hypothetical protein
MKTFTELSKLNVSQHIEKKNGLAYLSWAWAVHYLLSEDPTATWEFPEPKLYGETMMVYCTVHAMGKTMTMHLPVMDHRNQAVMNPDARKVSDSMMRCLAKCIASFGVGLYVYAGEDIPFEEAEPINTDALIETITNSQTINELKEAYFAAIKECKGNQEAQQVIDAAKDKRKAELSGEAK